MSVQIPYLTWSKAVFLACSFPYHNSHCSSRSHLRVGNASMSADGTSQNILCIACKRTEISSVTFTRQKCGRLSLLLASMPHWLCGNTLSFYNQIKLASTFWHIPGACYSLSIVTWARLTGKLTFCVLVCSWWARNALIMFSAIKGAHAAGNWEKKRGICIRTLILIISFAFTPNI